MLKIHPLECEEIMLPKRKMRKICHRIKDFLHDFLQTLQDSCKSTKKTFKYFNKMNNAMLLRVADPE